MVKTDKRTEILCASLKLIAEHGFHGAPIADIAEKAGVGAGTIYRYFENKDVIINELYQNIEKSIAAVITIGYSPDFTIKERFLHLSTQLIGYFITHPLEFRYVEQFHNSPYGTAFRKDKILGITQESNGCDAFKMLFEDGISRKEMKNFPIIVLFSLAFGPIINITRDHILGFLPLDEQMIEQVVSACWDGIRR